ncbi:MAG: hypothetical protein E6Q97_27505 [Desulfurellales bacterium]|nr:MAG: hypothetical protein E6Q97_27505 [Desulfurellales bacterium]
MTDTTNPQDVVPAAEQSLDDRIAAKFFGSQETPATAPEVEQPTTPVETTTAGDGELTPEDIAPDEMQTQTADEWVELDRKGEKRKVSKEEARNLAQQGWDYSEKMRDFKARSEQVEQMHAAVMAKAQLHPKLIDAAADVRSYERALGQFQQVDWSKLAQDDPIGYTQTRAHYDSLRDGYQQAIGNWQQVMGASQQVDAALDQASVAREFQTLYERAPEYRDPEKLKSEQGRVMGYLKEISATPGAMRMIASSAEAFLLVRDALRYRQAVKAKSERTAQVPKAPAPLKPGPAQERRTDAEGLRDKVKALHQAKDPERKKALLDEVIARKFGLG